MKTRGLFYAEHRYTTLTQDPYGLNALTMQVSPLPYIEIQLSFRSMGMERNDFMTS